MGFPDYKVQYLALNGTNNYFTEPTDCLRKPSRRLSHNETIRSKSAVRMLIRPSDRQEYVENSDGTDHAVAGVEGGGEGGEGEDRRPWSA